ncbi:BRO1-like domain-domain-containing protein [Kockovaella imperatae]|uniref:BRO domain-containing protein 1 n=1 Tax=Kockovaella imperatae TaxID=4999 RepID=A0A1Y1ULA4_9TREE|nr:BRO1-like domain-domain-containing protein [Kockovaella imperatae]ORX38284.1 BRO1-like domain-domain-containing protein [Kockovaella imperatae]
MAHQSPLIAIPRKTTNDVDWATPIRAIIANSYGESPSSYTEECSVLQRCRQDAVKGAGSDATARDLLYKYFGQLELLELRFSEMKVPFAWTDAFTLKSTTQTSLAFEKASIIHVLAAVLSSLASAGSRADGEGIKRSYFNSRASAGMLTYINDNFLHAPSNDLSREVVQLLIGIMMAQATEIFTEKLISEKKAPALVCRSANQVAGMYSTVVDDMKEFQGKGIFDRNWLSVLQTKAKLFASVAQYYRSTGDSAAGKHGMAVVRMKLADSLAQEAQRSAGQFQYSFVSTATPTLPHDAATSLFEICKAHASLCAEAKIQVNKDNDLIYHDMLPSEASLQSLEKLPPAAPITIQEVYSNQEVSKLIGPDIFARLVPMAVHESASMYSEEKAKLVRAEVERVDLSEGEIRATLEHLGLPALLTSWRRLANDDEEGEGDVEISGQLRRLAQDIQSGAPLDSLLRQLNSEREKCERDLRELNGMLDSESRECERMRVKYTPQFTQSPSGSRTAHYRNTITANLESLTAAASTDQQVSALWREIQPQIGVLSGGEAQLRQTAQQVASGQAPPSTPQGASLLDLQDEEIPSKSGLSEAEKDELKVMASQAQEKLDRLGKIRKERDDVLRDLKEKIQNDDVSSLLLLNRRSQDVEPQLFASELEKFRPYQGRIGAAISASQEALKDLSEIIDNVSQGNGVRQRQRGQKERQKRIRDWERSLERTGEQYSEVRAGAGKGLSYYESLTVVINDLSREVREYIRSRDSERNKMVAEIETRQRISGGSTGSDSRGLDSSMAGLSISRSPYASPPPPPPSAGSSGYPSLTPTSLPTPPGHSSTPHFPPPPPPPAPAKSPSNPYDFSSLGNLPSAFSTSSHQPSQPPPLHSSYSSSSSSSNPYPTPSAPHSGYTSPPPHSSYPPPPPARNPSANYYPPPSSTPQRQTSGSYPSYQPPPQQSHYQPPPQTSYQPPHQPQSQYAPPPPQTTYQPPSQPQYQPPSQQYQPPPNHPGSRPQYHPPSQHQPPYPSYAPPPSRQQYGQQQQQQQQYGQGGYQYR